MRKALFKGFAVLMIVALLVAVIPAAVAAKPPEPEADEFTPVQSKQFKPIDEPNPIDYKRLQQREDLLLQGRSAEAAALAKTGSDKILVILVEFAGTDTVTWNPGDIWDPIGNPDADDADAVFANNDTATYGALLAGAERLPHLADVIGALDHPRNPFFEGSAREAQRR